MTHIASAVLLADVLDWAPYIVFLVIAGLGALNQAIAKQREAPGKADRARAAQRRAAAAGQRGAGQEDKVEEFLRRMVQQRGGQQEAEVQVLEPPPAPRRETRRAAQPLQAAEQQRSADERLSQHHLHSDLELADERLETHLHEQFDHQLGSLRRADADAKAAQAALVEDSSLKDAIARAPTAAAGFAAVLRDAQGLRQAIVLREILSRPEERW